VEELLILDPADHIVVSGHWSVLPGTGFLISSYLDDIFAFSDSFGKGIRPEVL
jgi:hypothetical protein